MTRLEEKISNLSASNLYFARNFLGIINIVLFIITPVAVYHSTMPFQIKNILSWFVISIILLYNWFSKKIDKVLLNILVEKIDLDKYEAYWKKHVDSKLGIKAFAFHALGVVSFFRGDFEESLKHFEQSLREKRQSKKVRRLLEDDREIFVVQSTIFLERDGGNDRIDFHEMMRTMSNKPYLKAMLDIIYYKQPSLYLKNNKEEKKTKTGKLLYQYYKAENAVLLGNMEEAKAMFTTLSKENPQLFIVQEAKRKLAKM
ncbi:hypothetical protein [Streptococcus varani]